MSIYSVSATTSDIRENNTFPLISCCIPEAVKEGGEGKKEGRREKREREGKREGGRERKKEVIIIQLILCCITYMLKYLQM